MYFYGNHRRQWLLVKLTPFLLGAKTTFEAKEGGEYVNHDWEVV